MIHGEKESSFGVTQDRFGNKKEIAMMQCVHCQRTWEYKAGSGRVRGYCYKHHGLICGEYDCINEQYLKTGNKSDCISIEDQNNLIRAYVQRTGLYPGDKSGQKYQVTDDGKIQAVMEIIDMNRFNVTASGIIFKR